MYFFEQTLQVSMHTGWSSRDISTQIYVWLLKSLQDLMQVSSPDMVVAYVGTWKRGYACHQVRSLCLCQIIISTMWACKLVGVE